MVFLISHGFVESVCFLSLVLWISYNYITKYYGYWAERRVPFKCPEFPYGSMKDVVLAKACIAHGHDKVYKEFPNERFYGVIDFRRPALVIRDPDLVKQILVKDFEHFADRVWLVGNPKEYINLHLMNLAGKEWKDMRSKLTPTFTSGKLKLMFELMERSSEQLKVQLEKELKELNVIDVKDTFGRYALDVIVTCAFGIEANCIADENSIFSQLLRGSKKMTKVQYVKKIVLLLFPSLAKLLKINLVDRDVRDFVTSVVRDNIKYRKKYNISRNDFLDILMSIRRTASKENPINDSNVYTETNEGLTLEQMAAQTYLFFLGGFDTSSSLLTFSLYELSCHQNIQEHLYQEIKEAVNKTDGKISYEILKNIHFLDQVLKETLRLYGTAHALSRKCTKRYEVPGSDLVVEEGVKVTIPLFSFHHDPQYFPDPYAFKPERFSRDQDALRHPYVYLPFGEGPRSCLAKRFGMIQTKLGLATVLLNYQVSLSPEQEVPIEIDEKSVPIMPAHPVRLEFAHRNS